MTNLRALTTTAAISILTASSLVVAPARATPAHGFTGSPIVNGTFGTLNIREGGHDSHWGLILKTTGSTDLGADRLTLQPGGSSGWHAHPGEVFVTVLQGSIIWHNGSDPLCPSKTYTSGQSFIEPVLGIHNVQNASTTAGAEFVAITIKPSGFVGPAFRLDRPKPNNCNF